MAKSSFSRRDFLKISALSSASLLSGCASLDRYFMGDFLDLRKEVVILGAGAAGLAAAYELRKRKIPFRIFEASSRVGGRVQSVAVFPEEGPVGELGAEFFESAHVEVLRLAKELNLRVEEIQTTGGLEPQLLFYDKKIFRSKDISSRLKSLKKPLLSVMDTEIEDTISIQDLLLKWSGEVDPLILQILRSQVVARFGALPEDLSVLHFLNTVSDIGTSLITGRPQFRMEGGLSKLTQSLGDRISGVLPGKTLKLNHSLLEITEKEGVFYLSFEADSKKITYQASHVICTLPFSKLREVKGVESLRFSSPKKDLIAGLPYATHTKGCLPFASPFWRQKARSTPANLGNFTGDFVSQKFWDSGRSQEGSQGLLTFQQGGPQGAQADAQTFDQAIRDLNIFYDKVPDLDLAHSQMVNWSQRKWSKGSMAIASPGLYKKWKTHAGEAEYSGRFLFAGEHTSAEFSGTLQGALESGTNAASKISSIIIS